MSTVMLAAFQVVLGRVCGQDEFDLGLSLENFDGHVNEGHCHSPPTTTVLRAKLDGNPSFLEFLMKCTAVLQPVRTVRSILHEDMGPQEERRSVRMRDSLPNVVFSWRKSDAEFDLAGSAGQEFTSNAEFILHLALTQGKLEGRMEYAEDLIRRDAIERLGESLQSFLKGIVSNPNCPIQQLPLVGEVERRRLLEWNASTLHEIPTCCIHDLFAAQVARSPDAPAVRHGGAVLSYSQLNARANQLAHFLRKKGLGPDSLAGICVERGIDMVVGLLGILKAGGAYLPLDPDYPPDRLEYLLHDANPKVVLTHREIGGRLPDVGAQVVTVDADWGHISLEASDNLTNEVTGVTPENLAYMIYTSGSTGRPKGVAIQHRCTVNLIEWARSVMDPSALRQTLLSTSLNFDLSVYECFVPLSSGACLTVVKNALTMVTEPQDTTLVNTVPSALNGLLDSGSCLPGVKVVNLAGEALKKELVDRIFAASEVRQVCNLYGPSETTTYSTWICMPRDGGFIPSIGRPISNTQIYILDGFRQLVPIGVVGEIFIGGAGVARGYLNRPEMTAERFIADSFSSDGASRLYKTGDLGRWLADGTIEYLGRNDYQVKIRGYRIELGEIEALIGAHKSVKAVVVVAREYGSGEKRLVAYVVAKPREEHKENSDTILDESLIQSLRAYLMEHLPEHMVPAAWVTMDRLPLTPNGKIDRRALPAPPERPEEIGEYSGPRTHTEALLVEIWSEVLRVVRIGIHDNFFDVGGSSLLAVKLIAGISRRLQVNLSTDAVYQNPTIEDMAAIVESLKVSDMGSVDCAAGEFHQGVV